MRTGVYAMVWFGGIMKRCVNFVFKKHDHVLVKGMSTSLDTAESIYIQWCDYAHVSNVSQVPAGGVFALSYLSSRAFE